MRVAEKCGRVYDVEKEVVVLRAEQSWALAGDSAPRGFRTPGLLTGLRKVLLASGRPVHRTPGGWGALNLRVKCLQRTARSCTDLSCGVCLRSSLWSPSLLRLYCSVRTRFVSCRTSRMCV